MTRALAAILAALAVLAARPGAGEHEVYYRFTVLGFVQDGRGQPVAGREVALVRDRTGFTYLAETDARGFYLVIARLGDESAGETLTLRIGEAQTRVVAAFDPRNHRDERGTRVDREAGRFVERRAWFPSTLAAALGRAGR